MSSVCELQRLSMEHSGPLRRLYELRAIIATPPVPPDYDTSRRWRGQMIDDLRRFTTSVVAERHTVTTEVLCPLSLSTTI